MDKLLGFMIVQTLQGFVNLCSKTMSDKTTAEIIMKIEESQNNDAMGLLMFFCRYFFCV